MVKPYWSLDDHLQRVEAAGSAGEKQIARMFTRYGLRFFYEHPVAVVDRGKVRVWYADFWLPDYGVAVEYAGIAHHNDYSPGVPHKKTTYEANGIPCVLVCKSDLTGYWPHTILDRIRDELADRASKFDAILSYARAGRE